MALKIKSTPELYGEASRRFNEKRLRAEAGEGKVPKEKVKEMMDLCEKILNKAKLNEMGWKYTQIVKRDEAIKLIFNAISRTNDLEDLTDEEIENVLESFYGDNTNLPYYGANFSIRENE